MLVDIQLLSEESRESFIRWLLQQDGMTLRINFGSEETTGSINTEYLLKSIRSEGSEKIHIGEAIIAWRVYRNYTLHQLADLCGVSYSAISKIETGNSKNPRPSTVKKLSSGLGIPAGVLLRGEMPPEKD